MSNSAEIIARRLHGAGVRYAFGIPGGEVLTMIKALDETGIKFIMTKHENAAGFMAEGTYHASDAPAVLVATVGPGAANAVNFIANAMQDRVPVIYITGCVDAKDAVSYTHQVFDQRELLSSITKATFEVVNGAVDEIIDKAVAIAMQDPPGPVHINLPISVAASEQVDRKIRQRVPYARGQASGTDFAEAQQLFAEAKRPIAVAGVEVLYQHAEADVRQFVEQFNVPLITTYKGKGILPEDHALSLGGAGLSPKNNNILLPFMQDADLIILLGYDPIEMRVDWKNPWSEDNKVIEFSAIPNTHYMHQADLSFVGDVASSVSQLGLNRLTDHPSWSDDSIKQLKVTLDSSFAAGSDWGPSQLIHSAREICPRDTVATVDTGAHRILISQIWQCYAPHSLLQSTALCTMGCALPLATGYKMVNPDVPVVAFSGDAGLEMVLGDIATLRDSAVPIVIIVFVDESLALIEMKQRAMKYDNVGVDSEGSTDFVKIAEAFDIQGVWVDNDESFRQQLTIALNSSQSTLLACRIGRKSYDGRF